MLNWYCLLRVASWSICPLATQGCLKLSKWAFSNKGATEGSYWTTACSAFSGLTENCSLKAPTGFPLFWRWEITVSYWWVRRLAFLNPSQSGACASTFSKSFSWFWGELVDGSCSTKSVVVLFEERLLVCPWLFSLWFSLWESSETISTGTCSDTRATIDSTPFVFNRSLKSTFSGVNSSLSLSFWTG